MGDITLPTIPQAANNLSQLVLRLPGVIPKMPGQQPPGNAGPDKTANVLANPNPQTPTALPNNYTGKVDQTVASERKQATLESQLIITTPYAAANAYPSSELGYPIFTNITFNAGSYTDYTTGRPRSFAAIALETVLLTVSQAKKIVRTEIQGKDGTVKEYIGMDDYHIAINAIITTQPRQVNGHYPANEVAAVKQMLDAPVPIGVTCDYLQRLGIYSVVVTDYSIPQKAGRYSQQDITINCISDAPVQLQITQPAKSFIGPIQ